MQIETDLRRRLCIGIFASPMILSIQGCSTPDMLLFGGKLGANLIGMGVFFNTLMQETELFRRHWKILNDYKVPIPSSISEEDRKNIENDLQILASNITKEVRRLEAANPTLQHARYNQRDNHFSGFKVAITRKNDAEVRAIQDNKQPRVEISIGLLWRHLRNTERYMREQKEKVRSEWSNRLSGDELTNIVTERASIPISLEYKEALIFLIAHESVHIWLDSPDTEDETALRQQEIRADSLGLNIISNISYIVDVRRKNEGMEATMLNWQAGSPRSIQLGVLFARSGPEYLFEINQSIFSNKSPIYRAIETRQIKAATYMKKAIYGNLETPKDSYAFYLLNQIKIAK